jgi:hypothetical protein
MPPTYVILLPCREVEYAAVVDLHCLNQYGDISLLCFPFAAASPSASISRVSLSDGLIRSLITIDPRNTVLKCTAVRSP